jgi:predicted CopG family antitoxin
MTTKTLTIMEDAYKLLLNNKFENESFSETIRRILSKKKKNLNDFFGIISSEEGEKMKKDLENIKKINIKILKKRIR